MQYFGNLNQRPNDLDASGGFTLLYDYQNSLDPTIINPVQLGHWSFDDTNNWANDDGQLPLLATNVSGIVSWSTNAALTDNANPSLLCYPILRTNGIANISLWNGTIQFWFRPDWSSVWAGGTGPGTSGRLIEIGNYSPANTNGWWGLYFSADGNSISFGTSTNGAGTLNLSAGIVWTSNQWHQVVLTYSPTNSQLYLDGQLASAGAGVAYYPNATEQAQGFRVGSDQNGGSQARGAFDELETFNYPSSAGDIAVNYQAAVQWSDLSLGLPFIWQMNNFGYLGVDPNASTAGDGLKNSEKYIMGLPVQSPASIIHVCSPCAPAQAITPGGAADLLLNRVIPKPDVPTPP
jgi:hypothetical protein